MAQADYEKLFQKYEARFDSESPTYGSKNPSNDCLGCYRKVICAFHIPRCNGEEDVRNF